MYFNMERKRSEHIWSPCEVFNKDMDKKAYVLMILNRPIPSEIPRSLILNLWNKALLRVTVDGGTNQWLSWLKLNNYEQNENTAPDIVTGDMDSVSKEVLDTFCKKNKNLKIIKTPDQNETDFTKALRQVQMHTITNNVKIDSIFVLIDSSGRFDQILANVQTLFKAQTIVPNIDVILIGSNSLTWLLKEKTLHSIKVPSELIQKQSWCALIPIGCPCTVTTTGLKWNLKNALLEFGKIVSTSNTYSGEPLVTVESDNAIVWSSHCGLRELCGASGPLLLIKLFNYNFYSTCPTTKKFILKKRRKKKSLKCKKVEKKVEETGDPEFVKRQDQKRSDLDEQLREYITEWRKQRAKEEDDLKKLKEKQAKRKVTRAEEERKLAERKKAEEERRVREIEEKKQREQEEKRQRLEDAEKKRQTMMQALKDQSAKKGPNFTIQKRDPNSALSPVQLERNKTKEQLEEEKRISLSIRIKPLSVDHLSVEKLREKAVELWDLIVKLETEKYDLEERQKRQDYDLKELKERQKQQLRHKALKKGLDPEALTGKYPPKIQVASKYERRVDTRSYGDKKKLFEGGYEDQMKESHDKNWADRSGQWDARQKARLPKWFGERPGKKPGEPETPEGEEEGGRGRRRGGRRGRGGGGGRIKYRTNKRHF
ncbi:hypothetical protein RN001_004543 [Aquatica leii]|uniref:Thiamin pyrophosphokinase thiamin-binding domain-containing protein n=1 Tax=Aquatica leii TaxID=1421715 RepID=A0AAN7PYN0_9COLE|nr:hypothetical protein RN001_004543 [Aquatica leii]